MITQKRESEMSSKTKPYKQIKINNWRIIAIDEILQSGKPYTATQLAKLIGDHGETEKTDYSPRTIQRDLEYMRDTLLAPILSRLPLYRTKFLYKKYFSYRRRSFFSCNLKSASGTIPQYTSRKSTSFCFSEDCKLFTRTHYCRYFILKPKYNIYSR